MCVGVGEGENNVLLTELEDVSKPRFSFRCLFYLRLQHAEYTVCLVRCGRQSSSQI